MPGAFTIPLWEVLDIEEDQGDGLRIGLHDYPIWKPEYRIGLNRKIVRHFWNREIGQESIPLFKFALRRKMWEIMPLYNQVYASTEMTFDPFSTFDLTTVRTDEGTEHGTTADTGHLDSTTATTAGTNSGSRSVHSDTPQTELSGDEDYATSADDVNSATTAQNNGTQHNDTTANRTADTNTTQNGNSSTKGYQGSLADLLLKYRATLLNTDMMVMNELPELFMGIWDNGLEMLPTHSIGWIY